MLLEELPLRNLKKLSFLLPAFSDHSLAPVVVALARVSPTHMASHPLHCLKLPMAYFAARGVLVISVCGGVGHVLRAPYYQFLVLSLLLLLIIPTPTTGHGLLNC